MRCTADGATSTNRATHQGARRRTRAAPRSTVRLPGPHDEPSAQAHRTKLHVDEPGVLPCLYGPRHGVAVVVRRDIGPEEPSDPTPRRATGEVPRNGQHAARVAPPPESPERLRWDRELEACHRRAGFEDA